MHAKNLVQTEQAQQGFYPTPLPLAEKLLAGIDWYKVSNVLEPSAGKGNLVDAVVRLYRRQVSEYGRSALDIDCIEIDPYLRSILTYEWGGSREDEIRGRLYQLDQKREYDPTIHKYKELSPAESAEEKTLKAERSRRESAAFHLVHDDFLTFHSRKSYSLIVMNPPFSDGDAHLLHALEMIQRTGGEVRCLLNAETIRNPHTNRRKVLLEKLNTMGAEITYEDGAFSTAERPTDVSVAIIKVQAVQENRTSQIFERLKKASNYEETAQNVTDLALEDFLENIVSRFNLEVDAGLALIDEYNAMVPYILSSADPEEKYNSPMLVLGVGNRDSRYNAPDKNQFVRLVRAKYWRALFSNQEFMAKMTTNIREKYQGMVEKMQDYDFSLFNIQQITAEMNAELSQGIQDTIVALFDKMTKEHSWYPETQKNKHYFNGWATNKVHKIGPKVILPVNGMFSSYSWDKETFDLYNAESTISDIEKVFHYLDGDMTAEVSLHGVLQRAHDAGQTKNIQCRYFSVTLYKKGTMHLKFHDQDLVDRFNIYCCRKKNWLPPNYGKTKYQDMTQQEKEVVDSFQGEKEYEKVMQHAEYYLAPASSGGNLLALTG